MIEVKRLSKIYDEKEILKDVCLTIEKGEIFTIIGPTGSGKTTLLRLIDLLDRPTLGEKRNTQKDVDAVPKTSPLQN
jgi:ABC-type Fe3+/spermidine/putrescine transport system ATPase subunit